MEVISPDPRQTGIYTITHRASGRCYVGQSMNMHKRWAEHRSALRHNRHDSKYLQNTWNRHGEDAFDFRSIESCDLAELTEREQWWMDELLPVFNTCPAAGGTRGFVHSAEARGNMSAAQKGRTVTPEHRSKISATLTGRKLSPEHIAKMSAALIGREGSTKGRKLPEETRAKISAALTGRERSPEYRANISAGQVGRKHSLETKAKMSTAKKGKVHTADHRAKISAACIGLKRSPESRAKMSAAQRKRHQDKKMMEIAA